MERDTTHVAIDVGTSKVATLVSTVHGDGRLEVIGAGVVASSGVAKGSVVNIPEAQECIRASLEEAARSSGQPIRKVYATVTGSHLDFSTTWGSIQAPHYSIPVSYGEVDRAVEAAYPRELALDRQVLHLIPRSYTVDSLRGVRNPIGMHALRLDVETLCVTAASAPIRNLVKAIEHSRVRVASLVMSGVASGESVLTRDEREMGVLLVEIGGGVTTFAYFQQDALAAAAVLPVGGVNCTNDLALALSIPQDVAEEIKIRHGHLMPDMGMDGRVEIPSFGDDKGHKVERRDLSRYLRDRIEEILRITYLQGKNLCGGHLPPAGVVITGGSANLPGMLLVARRMLSCPVRIAGPRGADGLQDDLSNPAFSAAVGTLQWGVHHQAVRMAQSHKPAIKILSFGGGQKPGAQDMQATNGSTGASPHSGNGNGKASGQDLQYKAMSWLKERAKRVAL
jgi:cell division protein FtsA